MLAITTEMVPGSRATVPSGRTGLWNPGGVAHRTISVRTRRRSGWSIAPRVHGWRPVQPGRKGGVPAPLIACEAESQSNCVLLESMGLLAGQAAVPASGRVRRGKDSARRGAVEVGRWRAQGGARNGQLTEGAVTVFKRYIGGEIYPSGGIGSSGRVGVQREYAIHLDHQVSITTPVMDGAPVPT
jgi:hypothetical protein